jgi:hypothetical protein
MMMWQSPQQEAFIFFMFSMFFHCVSNHVITTRYCLGCYCLGCYCLGCYCLGWVVWVGLFALLFSTAVVHEPQVVLVLDNAHWYHTTPNTDPTPDFAGN